MKRAVRLVACAWLSGALAAWAQVTPVTGGIDLVVVKPTPTLNGGIGLEGATFDLPNSYQLELALDANDGLLALYGGPVKIGELLPFRLDAHVMGAYQVLPRLELSLDLPVTLYQSTNFGILTPTLAPLGLPTPQPAAAGLGDVRALARASVLDPDRYPLGIAAVVEVRLPTGNGASLLADRSAVLAPRAALEHAFGPVRVLADLGARIREPEQLLNLHVHNELTFGAGAILSLPDLWRLSRIEVVAETHLATPAQSPFTFSQATYEKSPWEVLAGARARIGPWGAELDLGRGVTAETGYGRVGLRVMAAVRYAFDVALPPTERDRDHDGVPDVQDACPDQPGPASNHGCPVTDTDGDGVPDVNDACPTEKGLPELDGCPDRDGDEIPDNVDKCPDEPGPAENDGCPVDKGPLVTLESNKILLRGSVLFETGKATIQKQSYGLLNSVYDILSHHPELGVVRVDGHTDNRGGRALNQDLSERRAHAVLEYLVHKGIPRERLRSKGFGLDKPIASNDNALGRAKNRRVEFTILGNEQKPQEPPPAPKK